MAVLIAVLATMLGAPIVAGAVAARRQPIGPDASETTCWRTAMAFAHVTVVFVAVAGLFT